MNMQMGRTQNDLERLNNRMDNTLVSLTSTEKAFSNTMKEKNRLLVFYNLTKYQVRIGYTL